tara:strand:+ start:1078 stop:1851 length:774 start_codon:yes stop_codon:yes gene_type:complete
MKFKLFLIIYFITYAIELKSHELWLEAKDFKLNKYSKLMVNIKVGENFNGESYPFLNKETEKLFIQNQNKIIKLKQIDGDYPAIQQNISSSGIQYLYYQSNKEFLEYDSFDTFLKFTKEYDLSYNNKKSKPPKEIYQRFAKMIFSYNENNFFESSTNFDFEIINKNNPLESNVSKILILLNNKPFKKKKFIVFFKYNNKFIKEKYQTDENGTANINTKMRGLYLVSAVYLENMNFIERLKYKADYFSKWATLTFRKY